MNGGVVQRTAFARTAKALEWALVQDGTGKTATEIYEMGDADRYLTAMLRARFYREKGRQAKKSQNKQP